MWSQNQFFGFLERTLVRERLQPSNSTSFRYFLCIFYTFPFSNFYACTIYVHCVSAFNAISLFLYLVVYDMAPTLYLRTHYFLQQMNSKNMCKQISRTPSPIQWVHLWNFHWLLTKKFCFFLKKLVLFIRFFKIFSLYFRILKVNPPNLPSPLFINLVHHFVLFLLNFRHI